jgi:hypothetical protein
MSTSFVLLVVLLAAPSMMPPRLKHRRTSASIGASDYLDESNEVGEYSGPAVSNCQSRQRQHALPFARKKQPLDLSDELGGCYSEYWTNAKKHVDCR